MTNLNQAGTHLVIVTALDVLVIEVELTRGVLPRTPPFSRCQASMFVVARQASMVGLDKVAALSLGNVVAVRRPVLGEDVRASVLVEEEELRATQREDAA